jgi:hypothetical protein
LKYHAVEIKQVEEEHLLEVGSLGLRDNAQCLDKMMASKTKMFFRKGEKQKR